MYQRDWQNIKFDVVNECSNTLPSCISHKISRHPPSIAILILAWFYNWFSWKQALLLVKNVLFFIKLLRKLFYIRDATLMWCLLSNDKGRSTKYLGCCSADPYPWKWDMFTHGKIDLLTMGQKYNVKSVRTTMDKNRFVSRLVWFFWVIWCTYY